MSTSIDSPAQPPLNMMTTVTADNHHQIEENQIDYNLITDIATNSNNGDDDNNHNSSSSNKDIIDGIAAMSRKEKRKAMKKMKRKQVRKEIAMKERQKEEARLNDPEEQLRLAQLEQEEAQRMERERIEFEERERRFLQALELKKKQEEEEEERWKLLQESQKEAKNENGKEEDEDDGWEYVEEGPAEIIWKGNEIIVKKKKVRVPKKPLDTKKETQESERPISNPLAPQSEVFEDYRNAQDVLESVAQQVPNFGTEQDKEHCPFHLKTGACRFGARCSRVHFYPDKACTLLLKNMYHGPGLAWEQDEGLEYTEEEAERSFEDFYEDVHTEFLKFGEIVNFKVCRNGSPHLRGNVYVHYKSLESAVLAYQSINGRYFAGKQLTCEYVNLTRWRVAICGEYMKSRLKTCSRGSACNFIHCFRNPGGDYEWADWDKPAPRYWLKSMAALFGYSSGRFTDDNSPGNYHSRSSMSRGLGSPHRKSLSNEDDNHKRRSLWRHRDDEREANYLDEEMQGGKNMHQDYHCIKHGENNNGDILNERMHDQRSFLGIKRSLEKRRESDSTKQDSKSGRSDAIYESTERGISDRYLERKIRSSSRQKKAEYSVHDYSHKNGGKVDQGEKSYVDKHHHRLHRKKLSQEKNETNTSNIDSHCHSSDSEEDKHHSHSKKNFRRMKNETDVSSSASDESRLGRDDERKLKNRRESPRLEKRRSVAEIGGDEDTLERDDDRQQHRPGKKSSRLVENKLETYEDGGRLGKKEKRPRKSSRLKDQLATEKESERSEVRRHRHSKKHSRRRKDYADSSDSASEEDRRDRYENRPQKSRRTSSRSRNESDFADIERSRERNDGEERHNGHKSTAKYNIKEPSLAKVGSNSYSRSRDGDKSLKKGETNAINFEIDVRCRNFDVNPDQNHPELEHPIDRYCGAGGPTTGSYIMNPGAQGKIIGTFDDTNDADLAYERDIKRLDKEHMLQMNKSDEKATASDGEAEAELEKACRYAALKRLEEIKKHKNTQAAHSSESLEGLKLCAHENVGANGVDISRVPEEAGSSELETNVASVKRRRI